MHENREISGASRSHQDRDRSAKALSHNADMHVSEKSDRATVPMNQPNKGEQSSAEVGEGRGVSSKRLACSVGDRPTGVRVRNPVAWIAGGRETELLEPIDKAIC